MDFKDSIKAISQRIATLKDNLQTEEATKNALIMPFISALGYDVFNPLEVLPEMNCDVGTKKGEKIDYAILRDGQPIILIECKHWAQDLNLHDNQLLRYFNVSAAKFGVLTNGIVYRFYTDLLEPNKMDTKPFLEVNLQDVKDAQIEELKKFHRSYFDVESILNSASELKYMGALKTAIDAEFANPSPELVKYFAKQVYDGICTQKIVEQFGSLLKRTISGYISDKIADRLKAAIQDEEKISEPVVEPIQVSEEESSGIVTTEEERESFYIIRAILCGKVGVDRIAMRDAQSYCAILFDDNNRKPICRLRYNGKVKKVETFDANKNATLHVVESPVDLYQLREQLETVVAAYLQAES
ncbi:MAG: type I restriction enzyme HsdR N-terminal domain-containing protein [Alistipes sp.]|nr:type I restriction enzyme HsdR N-terminal domain-containing protein [Alistipes sp.]